MSRQNFAARSTISTRLNVDQQQAIASRIAAIVATQNRLEQTDGRQSFYESLKNSLMLKEELGSDVRKIAVERGVYLDANAVEHLSKSLEFLANDNIVTQIELRLSADEEDVLNLSNLPISVDTLLVRFDSDVQESQIEEFWETIKELLEANTTLKNIDVLKKKTPIPANIQASLNQNAQSAAITSIAITPGEQNARAQLFGQIALTNQQIETQGSRAVNALTIEGTHNVSNLQQDVGGLKRDVSSIRSELIGINRRLGSVEERLAAVEANQNGMGNLLVTLAQNSSAVTDRDLDQFEAMVQAISINDDTPPLQAPSNAQEKYKNDFKFLTSSVLLNGLTRNMTDRQLASGDSGDVGFNPFKMIGGLLYEASRAFPLTAIVGAIATQGVLIATEGVEKRYWNNILKLSGDGSAAYRDLLIAGLAEYYQAHFEDPIPRETIKDSVGNFLNDMIGKGISTGRIRTDLDPHALHHVESLFKGISKQKNFAVNPNARIMATSLYQMQYPHMKDAVIRGQKIAAPRAAAEISPPTALKSQEHEIVNTAYHKQQESPNGSPSGSDRSNNSARTTQEGSRSNSDDSAEKKQNSTQAAERVVAPAQSQVARVEYRQITEQEKKRLDFRAKVEEEVGKKQGMFKSSTFKKYKQIETTLRSLDLKAKVAQESLNKKIEKYDAGDRTLNGTGDSMEIQIDLKRQDVQKDIDRLNKYLDEQIEKLGLGR